MARLSIELPDELVDALKLPPGEMLTRLQRELAIRLYEKGLLSFGKARELAGMSRWAFHDLLGDEGVVRRYDVDELEQDLRSLVECLRESPEERTNDTRSRSAERPPERDSE